MFFGLTFEIFLIFFIYVRYFTYIYRIVKYSLVYLKRKMCSRTSLCKNRFFQEFPIHCIIDIRNRSVSLAILCTSGQIDIYNFFQKTCWEQSIFFISRPHVSININKIIINCLESRCCRKASTKCNWIVDVIGIINSWVSRKSK